MIKYKMIKHDDHYIIYKYIMINNSVGFYKVSSGTRGEMLKLLNSLKEGVNYEKEGNKDII